MNVAFAANRRRVAKKFRDRANGRFDVRLCLFLCFELFLFAERNCGQYRATPGPEIFCGKIFTGDLAQILVHVLRGNVSCFAILLGTGINPGQVSPGISQ